MLSPPVIGQIFWFIAATAFNLASWQANLAGNPGWAGNTPLQAEIFVLMFGLVTLAAMVGAIRIVKFAGPGVILLLLVGGVARHFLGSTEDYASALTWAVAIGINMFGACAFAWGVFDAWRGNALR